MIYNWYIHECLTDEYQAKNEQNCQERDAYCARIGYTCICQCLPGYIMVNGHCLLGNSIFKKRSMDVNFLSIFYLQMNFQYVNLTIML